MFFRLFFLLNLAKIGHCFDDGEKFFRIKSHLSQEFSEFCIQLNETSVDLNETTTDALFIGSCEDDEGSQLWNVDSHSRMHNYIPKFRAGCIFNVNDTLVYEKDCSSPTNGLHKQFAKFNYNLFDDKIMNWYRAMHIKGTVKTGSPIIMQKPKPTRIQQNWKLDFVPLPEQIKLVDQRCQEFGPCGICTGDCGADHDCAEGLRCAQRNHDNNREDVPGCFWGEDSDRERYLDNDYCFSPTDETDESIVNYVGECSNYNGGYKCKKCEGDCDYDSDCEGRLKCFQRKNFEAVPGCEGEGGARDMYAKDICYDPGVPSVSPGAENCTQDNNCDICTTCENDEDCFGDLRCAKREANNTVPGCYISNTTNPSITSDTNICFRPLTFPGNAGIVNYVGSCSQSTYQCGRCEAGCTVDEDCQGSLICLERNATERVPGCFGEGDPLLDLAGKNVCYDNPSTEPELLWYGSCSRHYQCPECGGGCRNDKHCHGDLRCAIRFGIEDVPGCRWGSNASHPTFLGAWSFCFDPHIPTAPDVVKYIGECSPYIPGYLCHECEGHCKYDSDCAFDLKCLHRKGFENVPGCRDEGSDRDMWGKGICYDPAKFR